MAKRQVIYTILFFTLVEFFFIFVFFMLAQIFILPWHFSESTENTLLFIFQMLAEMVAIAYARNSLNMLRLRDLLAPVHLSCLSMMSLIIFTIAGILGADVFTDALNLPDLSGICSPNSNLKKTPFVIAYICIIAPIVEEIINRRIILGYMLNHSVHPVYAIILSSIIFGVSHMNPAQIPFATIVGGLLGIIYWKTQSIIIPIIIHIINNTTCTCIEHLGDFKYIDVLGGSSMALPVTIISFTICGFFCWLFITKNPTT